MQIALTEEAIRFTRAVEKLGAGSSRILLAVSGGPDSLAMLLLAFAVMPNRIAVATVDHGLRPEGRAEAEYVGDLCAKRNLPHSILTPEQPIVGNIQSSARTARYKLLQQSADRSGCAYIATAHHADDQLETLLMRLARGSGIDGLSGIRPRNGNIIRPLLEFSKLELEKICQIEGIDAVRDPSNDDVEFDRVAVRHWLAAAPRLLDVSRANQTASALQDAGAALSWMTDQLVATRLNRIANEIQCDASFLPIELQRRLALAALAMIDPDLLPRGETITRLIEDLTAGGTSTVGNILCKGGAIWRFSNAPPRRTG